MAIEFGQGRRSTPGSTSAVLCAPATVHDSRFRAAASAAVASRKSSRIPRISARANGLVGRGRGPPGLSAQDGPAHPHAHGTAGECRAARPAPLGRGFNHDHRFRPRSGGRAAPGDDGGRRPRQWRLSDHADLPQAARRFRQDEPAAGRQADDQRGAALYPAAQRHRRHGEKGQHSGLFRRRQDRHGGQGRRRPLRQAQGVHDVHGGRAGRQAALFVHDGDGRAAGPQAGRRLGHRRL